MGRKRNLSQNVRGTIMTGPGNEYCSLVWTVGKRAYMNTSVPLLVGTPKGVWTHATLTHNPRDPKKHYPQNFPSQEVCSWARVVPRNSQTNDWLAYQDPAGVDRLKSTIQQGCRAGSVRSACDSISWL